MGYRLWLKSAISALMFVTPTRLRGGLGVGWLPPVIYSVHCHRCLTDTTDTCSDCNKMHCHRYLGFDIVDYREHTMSHGANASAVAYMDLRLPDGGTIFGVGIDKNIVVASLKAVVSGVNRAVRG